MKTSECYLHGMAFGHAGSKFVFIFDEDSKMLGGGIAAVARYYGCPGVDGCIIIDDTFMALPEAVQRFLVYHELGHWVHGEIVDSDERLEIGTRLKPAMLDEVGADRYAIEHATYDAAEGMKEILKVFKHLMTEAPESELKYKAIEELDLRISQLDDFIRAETSAA